MEARKSPGALAAALALAGFLLAAANPGGAAERALRALPPGAAYGDYAVGTLTGFAVDKQQRFDPWNAAYGRPEYRAMLRRVEAAGQTRTVVFQLWYPAAPDASRGRIDGPRSPFPAASGRRAAFFDFYFRDRSLAERIAAAPRPSPEFIRLRGGGTLAGARGAARRDALRELRRRALDAPLGAWLGARPAEGRFPLVVLAHGLGGNHGMWGSFGEFLASRGYVAAAPTFVSDGSLALPFHDPDSPFARRASPEEVKRAYELMLGESKVVPYFYRLAFGREGRGLAPPAGFDPPKERLVPGGVARTTAMMRDLFRQRVADLGLTLRTARLLGERKETCRAALSAMGATSAARGLCGLLAGRIDGARAGLAGHSLGSMTAQLAANHLPGAAAALGFNNGPPFSWTPREMLGAGETRDGGEALPAGSRKPLMILIGDEDDFVQRVFIGLFQSAVAAAGGDPAAAFPLASERAAPDRVKNPQPVALSAWRRALSDRVLAIARDVDHGTLVEDFARRFPWPAFLRGALPFGQIPERTRKPTGARAFAPPAGGGERYVQLGWAEVPGAGQAYLPHVIRDWYAGAWFDWHLKGDGEARERLRRPDPFGAMTSVRRRIR